MSVRVCWCGEPEHGHRVIDEPGRFALTHCSDLGHCHQIIKSVEFFVNDEPTPSEWHGLPSDAVLVSRNGEPWWCTSDETWIRPLAEGELT